MWTDYSFKLIIITTGLLMKSVSMVAKDALILDT